MSDVEKKSSSVIGSHVLGGELAGSLSRLCKQLAADVRNCGQALGKAAKAKDDDDGDSSVFEALAATFDKGATDCAELSDRFMQSAQALATNKAAGGATLEASPDEDARVRELAIKAVSHVLGDRIVPDGVRGVVDYSLRPVLRPGMRELPSDGAANLDPALSKIIGVW